ncbi:MAG: MarR family transcriptional regulator [Woeseiaceae bacterium]|nr:MarR family transcriptional regulator [Woeseiaceae bacterium]
MDDLVDSISGRSAALYFADDPSLAQLLVIHGISIRDFILVSFLSDQGPLSIDRLARIMWIEPQDLQESVVRLAAAGLVIRDPESRDRASRPMVRLTGRGQDIAARIDRRL